MILWRWTKLRIEQSSRPANETARIGAETQSSVTSAGSEVEAKGIGREVVKLMG